MTKELVRRYHDASRDTPMRWDSQDARERVPLHYAVLRSVKPAAKRCWALRDLMQRRREREVHLRAMNVAARALGLDSGRLRDSWAVRRILRTEDKIGDMDL